MPGTVTIYSTSVSFAAATSGDITYDIPTPPGGVAVLGKSYAVGPITLNSSQTMVAYNDGSYGANVPYIDLAAPTDIVVPSKTAISLNIGTQFIIGDVVDVSVNGVLVLEFQSTASLSPLFVGLTDTVAITDITITDKTHSGREVDLVSSFTLGEVCYLRGTRILTVTGEVPVEDLRPGDVLVTRFGPLRPIRWIGKQSFDGRFLSKAGAPIRIRAGALGDNIPCRDLFVSPDHSVAIGDRLVVARLLLNGVSITQDATAKQVDYFHVDLGGHDCVIADGAWAESYAEQDNRNKFHNAAQFAELFPDHQTTSQAYCLPRVAKDAASLLALRVAVLARLPSGHFTSDADVHLLADGLRIEPTSVGGNRWEFAVPAGVAALRLVTHATSPAIMGTAFDDRALGFCISSLTARVGASAVALSPASNALHDGWYPVESNSEHVWRWTNGDAALPTITQLALSLDDSRDPVVLTIAGACLRRYLLTELPTAVLASDAMPLGVPTSGLSLAMTA